MPHVASAGPGVAIRRASPADLPAIEALLRDAGLPLDGVAAAFATGCVATGPGGSVLGAAAVEPHGETALLRSVVVAPRARGTGAGRALVESAEELAAAAGARDVWLLTETAAAWFPRLGYEAVERAAAPLAIASSAEFTGACPATAVLMRRHLGA